jgi:LysR family transcriptional activator of nhaA
MINYKHLHYFWVVGNEGSIARASERLHLTPQTISGQLSLLEGQLGEELFRRVGRNLELTEAGRMALSYADEIFSLGGKLEEMVHNLPAHRKQTFTVGIADDIPKYLAYRLLTPALQLPEEIRIVCREGSVKSLLAELAVHRVDLVIADTLIPQSVSVRGFNHPLGESGITFFAAPSIAKALSGAFPHCLHGSPMVLPGETTEIRGSLMRWLDQRHIHPTIVGEFDDSALMMVFGRNGIGVFIAPTVIAKEVEEQYGVVAIGQTQELRAQFYAISIERKIRHPAVAAVTKAARDWLTTEQIEKPVSESPD